MSNVFQPGLNDRCSALHRHRQPEFDALGIASIAGYSGAEVFDFGTHSPGTIEGGCLLASLCMADLGSVNIILQPDSVLGLPEILVRTDHPFLSCMAAQYAGWPVSSGDWFAMGSGPARILRQKEELFERYPVACEHNDEAWLILETAKLPDDGAIRMIAAECKTVPEKLRICVARTASLAGTIQIVARSIETTMHKLFELDFDLRSVVSGIGTAPLPPVGRNDLEAIGWTNDAILYGGRVWLCVDCDQEEIDRILLRIPGNSSADYGRPFREIFEHYNRDFYAIDRMLFSPAEITIHNLQSGRTVRAGGRRNDVLRDSFGLKTGN